MIRWWSFSSAMAEAPAGLDVDKVQNFILASGIPPGLAIPPSDEFFQGRGIAESV
jgi:hypothetical protein